ncbi:MAG TPA: DUF6285 domain-containing protein [Acidimicrobiia bacterium]|nr:DUF6285 domain-containing protein [Acidimicrobiia bacterium]
MPDDRPTAPELLDAVTEFLADELQPALDGRLAFHTRVAVNALRIARRELELGPALDATRRDGLPRLLDVPADSAPLRDLDVELARRVRAGGLDARRPELIDYLRATLRIQLDIAHPGYARDTTTEEAPDR